MFKNLCAFIPEIVDEVGFNVIKIILCCKLLRNHSIPIYLLKVIKLEIQCDI
jgi:hypothetical protein